MKSVVIPGSVTSIGDYAFSDCKSLKAVTIPDGVKEIRYYTFNGCTALTDVSIPGSVETIGTRAFCSCSALETVNIPSGVTAIADQAFAFCSSLKNVSLPASLTNISPSTFFYCKKLTAINVADDSADFASRDGVLFSKDRKTLLIYPNGKADTSYAVPSGVKTLGFQSFSGSAVEQVILPEGLEQIGDYTFDTCPSLTTVIMPSSLESIGNRAFAYSSSLTGISIPAGVSSIGTNPFEHCIKLAAIEVADGNTGYKAVDDMLMNAEGTTVISYPPDAARTTLVIPETVTTIGISAFMKSVHLQSVRLPDSLQKAEPYAFAYCSGLTDVNIPEGLSCISYQMFLECTGLTSVTIPSSVEKVDNMAFAYCTGLSTVTILAKSPKTGSSVFYNANVETVRYAGTQDEWNASGWKNLFGSSVAVNYNYNPDFTVENGVLTKYNGAGGDVTVPEGVTSIGSGAFYNCTALKKVTMPNGVTSIASGAFYNCIALTDLTIPKSVTSISSSAFYNCSSLTEMTVPNGVTILDAYTFYNCTSLKRVTIPGSVQSLGNNTFGYCTALTEVIIPEGLTSIGDSAFSDCSSLKTLQLSGTVTSAGSRMVTNCLALTAVNVADSNQNYCSVEGVLFNKNKTSLLCYPSGKSAAGYSVPSGVTTIGDLALMNCKSLQSVTIPDSVTSIGYLAFGKCGSLRDVNILAKSPEIGTCVFENTSVASVNYIGSESEWNASGWKDVFDSSVAVNYNASILSITRQPTNQSIALGKSVTLSVKATGDSLQYQWFFKKKGQTSFSVWNGHTAATETASPNASWDGIQLYCNITDSTGKTVDSDTVTVSVLSIATQPKDVTVAAGKDATFIVKATGTGLKYQWQYKKNGATAWSNWNGRTTASTTATANATWNGMQVRCVVTDGAGNKVNSNAATVTIASGVTITRQPTNQSIVLGKSVTLSVKATGIPCNTSGSSGRRDRPPSQSGTDTQPPPKPSLPMLHGTAFSSFA